VNAVFAILAAYLVIIRRSTGLDENSCETAFSVETTRGPLEAWGDRQVNYWAVRTGNI
jgi:hypothetical protein